MLIGTRLCHCRQQAILQKGQKLRPPKGRSEMWTQIILVRGEPSRNCPIPTTPTEADLGFVEVGFRKFMGWLEQSLCCSCTHAKFSFFFKEGSGKQFASSSLSDVTQGLFLCNPLTAHERQTLLIISGGILKFRSSEKWFTAFWGMIVGST